MGRYFFAYRMFNRPSTGGGLSAVAGMLILAIALTLSACGGGSGSGKKYKARPMEGLYNAGVDNLKKEKFEEAAKLFQEVERQHPYSEWAVKAQLMSAYAHYQLNEYDEAIIALDEYIQLHPSNRNVPYAHYLKALSYYEQISDVERDQAMTQRALKTLKEIIARYPTSEYAKDAKLKLNLTYDHLGGKEMDIGRKYLLRKQYLAAINRFKRVIDLYQTTTHVPEALHRLTEAYLAIGLKEEAQKTAAVLGHNFPGNEWYQDSYRLMAGQPGGSQRKKKTWYKFW